MTTMVDEISVKSILARHFPTAKDAEIREAARDIVLLNLLADDRILAWEDSLRDRQNPSWIEAFAPEWRLDS
jgi:hypothetical protein